VFDPGDALQVAKESSRHVDSVLKALTILDCFSREQPQWSLKDFSRVTQIHKSGILRLCGTLESRDYLRRDPSTGFYQLGSKLLTLGKTYEDTNSLISLASPILKELVKSTGESASLFVQEKMRRVCLAKENGPQAVRFTYHEGQVLDLTAGAGGKIFLAYSEPDFFNCVIANSNPAIKANRKKLEKELKSVRKKGYAVSLGEMIPDAAAVAAPVFNHENKLCAVITLAGPLQRFSPTGYKDLLVQLRGGTEKLSILLGQKPNP
jgi:IclR family transcriptional regulator, KDG regulon repressor